MVFEAKNGLQQYLSSINPIYAKYTEGLWANEVNSISQLGDASLTVLQCGVENPVHAGNIIAQSRAPGKWSSVPYRAAALLPCGDAQDPLAHFHVWLSNYDNSNTN